MGDSVNQFTVFFEGHVQGVGFRFSTHQMAKGFDVAGCVKNLADGRVQLDLEGERDECLAFIKALSEEMAGFIRASTLSEGRREPQFKGFTIQ
jgi:acylphosphatase